MAKQMGKEIRVFLPQGLLFLAHHFGSGCTPPLLQLLLPGPCSIALFSKKDLMIPFSSLVSLDI